MAKKKNADAWAEAKKRCRLNTTDIQMAKELGMTPKSLIKNIPSPKQQWKVPVKEWIRELYEKKFGKTITVQPTFNKALKEDQPVRTIPVDDEDLPF